MRLLVTRPNPGGERTAERLSEHGCEVILAPLLQTEMIAADFGSGSWGALVITSANAIRAFEQHPRRSELLHLPVFAVGARTADAACAAGLRNVTSADGDQNDLVQRVVAVYRLQAPLLYLAGEDRAGDLAGDLARHGINVRTVVIYRAARIATLPPHVQAELAAGLIEGVLHYSRRSAEAYLECAATAGILNQALMPVHYCLSRTVAEPLVTAGANAVRVAQAPDENRLINLIVA